MVAPGAHTTGIVFFIKCLRHSAKAILHSAKSLPSVTLGKHFIGKGFFADYFFRTLGKDFTECRKAPGKEKHSANILSANGSLPSTFFGHSAKTLPSVEKHPAKKNTRQIKDRKKPKK